MKNSLSTLLFAAALLLTGCGYHGEKISAATSDNFKRVAVVSNVGNDMFLLRQNQGPVQFIAVKNLLGSDIDVTTRRTLEEKLAARHTIVPVAIDYAAMEAAESRFLQAAAAAGGSADATQDNIGVLRAGLGSGARNNVDGYIYLYRSSTRKCEDMYGLTSSGALVLGPVVAVSGDKRWNGQGLTLYGFHDWLAGEKYFVAANIGIIVLNANFQPVGPQLVTCVSGGVDKSAWIGPPINKPLDGFDIRTIHAGALAPLEQQFIPIVQRAALGLLTDMGWPF